MTNLLRILPWCICCRRRPWLCIADILTRCKVPRICDAHDRYITQG